MQASAATYSTSSPTHHPLRLVSKKPKKLRADFRKNRGARPRRGDLTRSFAADEDQTLDAPRDERISGKGELTRKRTIVGQESDGDQAGLAVTPQCRRIEPPRPRAPSAWPQQRRAGRRRLAAQLRHPPSAPHSEHRPTARRRRRRLGLFSQRSLGRRHHRADRAAPRRALRAPAAAGSTSSSRTSIRWSSSAAPPSRISSPT